MSDSIVGGADFRRRVGQLWFAARQTFEILRSNWSLADNGMEGYVNNFATGLLTRGWTIPGSLADNGMEQHVDNCRLHSYDKTPRTLRNGIKSYRAE